jgi:hypothetical protein
MSDIITDLASKAGINADLAKKGLGTVLAMFKDKLPENIFSQIQSAVPDAHGLIESAEAAAPKESGGILSAVTGLAGKLFGGGSAAAMVSKFTHLGFSTEQLHSFIPKVIEFLKSKMPPDVMKQISALLPGGGGEAAS